MAQQHETTMNLICASAIDQVHSIVTVVMDIPEIIGLYNVKSILTDNSI